MTAQIQSFNLMNHLIDLVDVGERMAFLVEYLKGKKVLHVGCTGYPRFDPAKNLHLKLVKAELAVLHGLDIDAEGIETMRQHTDQPLFKSYGEISEDYDVILLPEVLEHILNPGEFLGQLMALDAKEILLTVPNAVDIIKNNNDIFGWITLNDKRTYAEVVHEDHCCYYSPMTICTTVNKAIATYTPKQWAVNTLFLTGLSIGCSVVNLKYQD